ncbi:MAG: hypothetical protein ABF990_04270 [Acetobacter sp.]
MKHRLILAVSPPWQDNDQSRNSVEAFASSPHSAKGPLGHAA